MRPLLISLATGFVVFYAAHVVMWRRYPSNAPRVILLTGLMILGLVISLTQLSVVYGAGSNELFLLASFALCMYMCYMYLYSGIARAVSLTIITRVLNSAKPIPVAELIADYEASSRFEDRLVVMKNTGWIDIQGTTVSLTERGRSVARAIRFISNILTGGLEG